MIVSVIIILILVLIVYFFLARPERKKQKNKATMLNSIKEGMTVYTSDGIRGTVNYLKAGDVMLSCFPDATLISFDLEKIEKIENYNESLARAEMKAKIKKVREKKRQLV